MKVIELGDKVLPIASIDCIIKRSSEEGPGILVHTSEQGSINCIYLTETDRDLEWEEVDALLSGEGYIDCEGMFFRPDAIGVVVAAHDATSGAYVQITLRGGLVIRRPCSNDASAEHYRAELTSFLGNRACLPQ